MGAAMLLAVFVLVGASALVIPMLLAMVGAGVAAWRWWSAMGVAGRLNDEVRSSPGRHARPDGAVDLSALVPGQRSDSPVLPPSRATGVSSASAVGAGDRSGADSAADRSGAGPSDADRSDADRSGAGRSDAEQPGGEGRHRFPRR
jgi:hypothetical protein